MSNKSSTTQTGLLVRASGWLRAAHTQRHLCSDPPLAECVSTEEDRQLESHDDVCCLNVNSQTFGLVQTCHVFRLWEAARVRLSALSCTASMWGKAAEAILLFVLRDRARCTECQLSSRGCGLVQVVAKSSPLQRMSQIKMWSQVPVEICFRCVYLLLVKPWHGLNGTFDFLPHTSHV